MGKRKTKTGNSPSKTEKLANYARKRQTKLLKYERLLAEREYLNRTIKEQRESLAADDRYLLKILGE